MTCMTTGVATEHKIAVPELGQKMAVSDCQKNKIPKNPSKTRLVDKR